MFIFTKGDIKYEMLLVVSGGSAIIIEITLGVMENHLITNLQVISHYIQHARTLINQVILAQMSNVFHNLINMMRMAHFMKEETEFQDVSILHQVNANSGQATSWCLDTKAIGTDGFNENNGSVKIKYKC